VLTTLILWIKIFSFSEVTLACACCAFSEERYVIWDLRKVQSRHAKMGPRALGMMWEEDIKRAIFCYTVSMSRRGWSAQSSLEQRRQMNDG